MSTKTTFKRVALVAVAALGFGMISVVPSSAATLITALSAGTSSPARVGVVSGATKISITSSATTSQTETLTAQIVSAPATSTKAALSFVAGTAPSSISTTPSTVTPQGDSGGVAIMTYTHAAVAEAVYVAIKADVAGSYQILVTADASSTGFASGKVSTNYTITTTGAPTALTLASYAGKATTSDAATHGQLFKLSMTDANGNATVLGLNEALSVTSSDTTYVALKARTGGSALASFGAGEDYLGAYYVRAVGLAIAADATAVLTVTGSGLLPNTLTTTATITEAVTTAAPTAATIACTTSARCVAGSTWNVSGAAALTAGVLATSATAATVHAVKITDKYGFSYTNTLSVAATTTALTITGTATLTGPSVDSTYTTASLELVGATASGTTGVVTFNYVAPAMKAIAIQGQSSVLSATGAKNSFTALVTDSYGVKIANVAVTATVAGRNTVATTTLGVTDANGLITYSFTDAGTTGTKDTVTLAIASGTTTSALAYVNYGTVVVSTVTVTGGSTVADDGIAGLTKTAIKGSDNGPEASSVAIKAVVKDASGNLLAGVPVVFTVSSGLVKKTAAVDFATVYTGTDGSATSYVFDWKSGTQTITATAGGKTGTDYLTWASTDASTARVLSASATGDIVSLKVVDRFGNAVSGVTINLSRTGAGLFGNGASTQEITTDKNGTADVRFTGSGTVVAELAATYAQSYDVAGKIAATAATAAVAGTTAGTGNTFTPAGVSKVSVDIAAGANAAEAAATAAADAAAEATDAANAATDAANAAAEAADAATAAAQDAADAVAALSTQVSEMVNALKKQITALTNLVIKIQKKVKA